MGGWGRVCWGRRGLCLGCGKGKLGWSLRCQDPRRIRSSSHPASPRRFQSSLQHGSFVGSVGDDGDDDGDEVVSLPPSVYMRRGGVSLDLLAT